MPPLDPAPAGRARCGSPRVSGPHPLPPVPALALAAALVLPLGPAVAQDLFLAGGRLVDPATETVREAGLLIVGGVIQGTPAAPPEGFRGEVLDATGRWVIPGLHDLHVHSLVNQAPGGASELIGTAVAARRMLYAGVTGFLDLFNQEDYVLGLRERLRGAGEPPAADLFAAGPCLTATGGHCTEYPAPTRTMDSPEEARREIAELAGKRPDVVKVVYDGRWMPTIDEETLAAALEASAEQGLPSVVHFGTWNEARAAVSAGATAVTHVRAAELPADLPALLAERGTYFIPTLTAAQGLLGLAGPEGRWRSPLLQAVAPARVVQGYRTFDPAGSRVYGYQEEGRAAVLEAVRRMAEAGVPIVAGTDSGNLGTVLGYSLHHELALLVEAGLTPWEALRAATTTAGDLLGRPWGLDPGDEGSVVVLEASPIAEIENTERIAAVVHHGVVIDREALAAELFPGFWSPETLAAAWTHVRPVHLVALALVAVVLAGGVVGVRRLARRVRRRRATA